MNWMKDDCKVNEWITSWLYLYWKQIDQNLRLYWEWTYQKKVGNELKKGLLYKKRMAYKLTVLETIWSKIDCIKTV